MKKLNDKLLNKIIIAIYLAGCVIISIYTFVDGSEMFVYSFLSPLFLLIPIVLEKIFKLRSNYFLNNTLYIFCFFAFCIGVIAGVYQKNFWYDKVVHMFSGILFTSIGAYIYELLNGKKNVDLQAESVKGRSIYLCFSVFFSLSIGYIWEVFEYFQSIITGRDVQWVEATAVGDTMQDMIANLIGTVLMMVYYIYRLKKHSEADGKEDL